MEILPPLFFILLVNINENLNLNTTLGLAFNPKVFISFYVYLHYIPIYKVKRVLSDVVVHC